MAMRRLKLFFRSNLLLPVLLMALPMPGYAQIPKENPETFTQQELDRMLAPIALYPDSLLAQILMASTYPLEVIMADRWLKENKGLQADQLNDALDKQPWDASVKALVPFPEVLSMMSEKLDWTPVLGEAFLAQKDDVIRTVQDLRQKAHEAGNLKSSEEQTVTVEKEIIVIAPTNPQVLYVPVYDPWWVYGSWWWPAYPPYAFYPYAVRVAFFPGRFWFGPRCRVGPYWGRVWGRWDWRNRHFYANVNRNINVNRRYFNNSRTQLTLWRHDPSHRRNVAYRNPISRTRYSKVNRSALKRGWGFRAVETKLRNGNRSASRKTYSGTGRSNGMQANKNRTVTGKKGGMARRPGTSGVGSPHLRGPSKVTGHSRKTGNRSAMDNRVVANTFRGNRSAGVSQRQGGSRSMASFGGYSRGTAARGGFGGGGSMGGGRWGGPSRR
jgi:hypothetical protein